MSLFEGLVNLYLAKKKGKQQQQKHKAFVRVLVFFVVFFASATPVMKSIFLYKLLFCHYLE